MKPKLFFLINSLHKGGAERVLSTLSNSFYNRSFPVFIICLNYSEQAYPINKGIRVIYLLNKTKRSNAILMRLLYAVVTYFRLLYLLLKERPGCVIAFMTTSNLWAGLTCGFTKTPYIVSERIAPDLTIKRFGRLLQWLSYHVFKNAKAIVSPAKGVENCLKGIEGFRDLTNYEVINNPVNRIEPVNTLNKLPLHPKAYVLAVGRLTHQKGFDILVDAFTYLKDLNVDLLIIGQGPEAENLSNQIARLKLSDRIFLLGVKDNIADYFREAEIFVLSSRNEGYPNALIEAMSLGCACIAMNCKFGPAEIINHGINGLLLDSYNPIDLAHLMRALITNPELKGTLAENAKHINEKNSLEMVLDKWENLIHTT